MTDPVDTFDGIGSKGLYQWVYGWGLARTDVVKRDS